METLAVIAYKQPITKAQINALRQLDSSSIIQTLKDKELIYEMLDFHKSRPGHDLRYALDGTLMRNLGWEPKIAFSERIKQVSDWYLQNTRWLEL